MPRIICSLIAVVLPTLILFPVTASPQDGQVSSDTRQQATPGTDRHQVEVGDSNGAAGDTSGTNNAPPGGDVTNPATAAARQAANRRALMNRFGAVGLYGYHEVPWFADTGARQQLGLNKLQYQHLRELYGQRFTKYVENFSELRGREVTDKERAQFRQFREDFANDIRNGYEKLIEDPMLRQRFRQLDLQYQGLNAFTAPSVQKHLDLTSHDVAELRALAEELNAELAEVVQRFEDFPDQINGHFQRVQKDRDRALRRILGGERYAQWEDLIGEHYQFPAAAYVSQPVQPGNARDQERKEEASSGD